tara:strand:- start:201 stop:467 length:267 start_codon:yes stop_codon:yes gene_type:complete
MPGVSRVGVDTAAGTITGPGASTVFVNGSKVSLIGDSVAAHSPGGIHNSATMVEGSSDVKAEGTGVVRAGDAASCGHTATGSSDTFAN